MAAPFLPRYHDARRLLRFVAKLAADETDEGSRTGLDSDGRAELVRDLWQLVEERMTGTARGAHWEWRRHRLHDDLAKSFREYEPDRDWLDECERAMTSDLAGAFYFHGYLDDLVDLSQDPPDTSRIGERVDRVKGLGSWVDFRRTSGGPVEASRLLMQTVLNREWKGSTGKSYSHGRLRPVASQDPDLEEACFLDDLDVLLGLPGAQESRARLWLVDAE